jgi:hypothetical protein
MTCAICGLAVCAHFVGLTLVESAHSRLPDMLAPYSTIDHEHDHRENSRSVRLQISSLNVGSGTAIRITPLTGELRFGR